MILTVTFGLRTVQHEFSQSPTVREIKSNQALRAKLGYGDNVKILLNSVEQPDNAVMPGPEITVESAANQKAE